MAVTQGLGDGFALYNGVKLPNIDSVWTDKETYPYAYICYYVKRNRYELYFAKKWASGLEPGIVYATPHSSYLYSFGIMNDAEVYYLSGDSWAFYTSHSTTGPVASKMSNNSPTWSNVTIYTDSSLSSLYLAATSPIPLDGMQVIEWDGDTSGLVSTTTPYAYKISDIVLNKTEMTNAVFCFTDGTTLNAGVLGENSSVTEGNGYIAADWIWSVSQANATQGGLTFPEIGLYVINVSGAYVPLLAYTPAAEPEQPKWQFNLQDFLSGAASAAASRGVLRRTPIAYQNMSEEVG